MTLQEILFAVQHIAQIYGKNIDMSLEQYNRLLKIAQDELWKEMVHGYLSGNGVDVDARTQRFLHNFKWVTTPSPLSASTKFGIDGQSFSINVNDVVFIDAWAYDNSADYPDKVTKIDIVTQAEAIERMSNAITYPSTDYPILVMDKSASGTTLYGEIIPNGWTAIKMTSIRRPTTDPTLILTLSGGVYSQSGSSVDLEVDSIFHNDIIRKILQYLGLVVSNDMVVSILETQKQNEK